MMPVRKLSPYISPHAAISKATMAIQYFRFQRSEISAAISAPGTAPRDIADDHPSDCTREKPCATSNVGTQAVKP